MKVTVRINGCRKCSHCHSQPSQQGSYLTVDCYCGATHNNKTIVRNVEWDCQIPDKPPKWCPKNKNNTR